MKQGYLADYFDGVAVKSLSMVDATPTGSNQHEIGTTKSMREEFLRAEKTKFEVTYVWLEENEEAIVHEDFATHYDSRENNPKRSPEWRLYYTGNPVTELMKAGDSLFLAKRKNESRLVFIITRPGTTVERQLLWLFGLQRPEDRFQSTELSKDDGEVSFAAQLIFDELGIEYQLEAADRLDEIVSRFNGKFPTTREFSLLARQTCEKVAPRDEPDKALETWLSHEEAMFRRLELQVVRERLRDGFATTDDVDVEGFLKFSLGVQNRRKSRMGRAFENHLAALFTAWDIRYEQQAITENNQKPDFIFPDLVTYQEAVPGEHILMMLGVKSTCKDRWRQILPEAAKIPNKHLATIEPSISESQTDQMQSYNVQLVVPTSVKLTYSDQQQDWLWTFSDFLGEVIQRQRA
ncbi:MAG: restriction endonuclease [Ahrensia sp.]|nr:restriction endonuclease [Ahrensia sp.]